MKLMFLAAAAAAASAALSMGLPAATPARPKVVVIGDSLTIGADKLGNLSQAMRAYGFSRPTVDAKVGRPATSAVERIRSFGNKLPPVVVIGLGTNDVVTTTKSWELAKTVDDVMKAVGPNRTVVWVNVWVKKNASSIKASATFNEVLRVADAGDKRLRVADMASLLRDNPGWFTGDGIHQRDDGYRARAQLIAERVAAATS